MVLAGAITFSFYEGNNEIQDKNKIYKTWKVDKYFLNGKLVVNSKYSDMLLKVNKDGTAFWISGDQYTTVSFRISEDARTVLTGSGLQPEERQEVFELRDDKFRFGKTSGISRFEYVMEPVE